MNKKGLITEIRNLLERRTPQTFKLRVIDFLPDGTKKLLQEETLPDGTAEEDIIVEIIYTKEQIDNEQNKRTE